MQRSVQLVYILFYSVMYGAAMRSAQTWHAFPTHYFRLPDRDWTWLDLAHAGEGRFTGTIRGMTARGTYSDQRWPITMTLSPDGAALGGTIRPPGQEKGFPLTLLRGLHVADHQRLRATLDKLAARRRALLARKGNRDR